MARPTWRVIECDPGCLPESYPGVFTNRRAAETYAADLARSLRDDGYRVTGSARSGRYDADYPDSTASRVITVDWWPAGSFEDEDEVGQ